MHIYLLDHMLMNMTSFYFFFTIVSISLFIINESLSSESTDFHDSNEILNLNKLSNLNKNLSNLNKICENEYFLSTSNIVPVKNLNLHNDNVSFTENNREVIVKTPDFIKLRNDYTNTNKNEPIVKNENRNDFKIYDKNSMNNRNKRNLSNDGTNQNLWDTHSTNIRSKKRKRDINCTKLCTLSSIQANYYNINNYTNLTNKPCCQKSTFLSRNRSFSRTTEKNILNEDINIDKSALEQTPNLGEDYPNDESFTSCQSCLSNENKSKQREEFIKIDLLFKLQLERPPNITDFIIPRFHRLNTLINTINNQSSIKFKGSRNNFQNFENSDGNTFKQLKILKVSKSASNSNTMITFNLTEFKNPKTIKRADLGIYLNKNINNIQDCFSVTISTSDSIRNNYSGRKNRWLTIDFKNVMIGWIKERKTIPLVNIYSHCAVVSPRDENEENYRPYLEIELQDLTNEHSRQKRKVMQSEFDCDKDSQEIKCCRHPLEINFAKFKWDSWIIAPRSYSAYFCNGFCPYGFRTSTHGSFAGQFTQSNACCSPKKMSKMSMLYMDEDKNIIYGEVPNMVVDRCACN